HRRDQDRESKPDPDTKISAALALEKPPLYLAYAYSTLTPFSEPVSSRVATCNRRRLTAS
ncbi:MAG: hypothetical protein WBC30_01745, partial [Candidatus Sulfotelmatobacter sp.]